MIQLQSETYFWWCIQWYYTLPIDVIVVMIALHGLSKLLLIKFYIYYITAMNSDNKSLIISCMLIWIRIWNKCSHTLLTLASDTKINNDSVTHTFVIILLFSREYWLIVYTYHIKYTYNQKWLFCTYIGGWKNLCWPSPYI